MTSDAESRETTAEGGGATDAPTPKSIGKYELQRELGAGGMGTVHLARDTEYERVVALKVLPREKAENETLVKRFKSEALAAAQLRHDNIVAVYEAGTADGLLYIAMEYVDGRDVHEMVAGRRKTGMDVSQTTGIIRQSALALQHAYEKGIVHRDIKPSNLMVDRKGIVKLADMGLARNVDDDEAGITRAGTTVGTVDYMSPEQATNSHKADIRSDIYSLGCTWYHMLVGEPPFPDGSLLNKLKAHAMEARPDPRKQRPEVPEGIVAILHQMMERSPKKRFQTPAELVAAIDTLRETAVADDEAEQFAAQLAAVVEATPEIDRRERDRAPSTRSTTRSRSRSGVRTRPRSRSERPASRSTRTRRRRRSKSNTGPIVAGIAVFALLGAGGIWWAVSGSGTNDDPDVVDVDKDDPGKDDPVDPGPVGPGPDPGPDDPGPDPGPVVSERITIGSPTERPMFADWVADVLLPEEAARPPAAFGLQSIGVGGPEGSDARYRELSTAMETAPPAGRAIRLNGPGPFVLDPLEITGRGQIVIAGDPAARPLVVVDNDDATGLEATVSLNGASLMLVDVDILVDGRPRSGPVPTAIRVTNGDLVLRRCSVTFRDDPNPAAALSEPVHLLQVDGIASGRAPRVLLDRVAARGGDVVLLDAVNADVTTWNTLLATETGPAIRLASEGASSGERHVDLFSTTIYASEEAFRIDVPANENPPETKVRVHATAVATRENGSTLLRTVGWPIVGQTGLAQYELPGLSWTSTASAYPGWEHTVVSEDSADTRTMDGDSGWQSVLEPGISRASFPLRWPVGRVTPADVEPGDFDATTGTVALLSSPDGNPIAAAADQLSFPAEDTLKRGRVLATRPGLPANIVPPSLSPIPFTIGPGRDLGAFLSSDQVPDGGHVIVDGEAGQHVSSPIFLDGKSVRLEFRSPETGGIEVRVRGSKIEPAEKRRGRQQAFITVKDASLEIIGGNFVITVGGAGTQVEWFLHATDADIALRRCILRGPTLETTSIREMIRWESSDSLGVPGRAVLADTFIVATRPILSANIRHRSIAVRNCVLVSTDNLFELDVTSFDPKLDAGVDLRNTTLCTPRTFFEINGRELPRAVQDPLRIYADRTLFGDAFGIESPRGTEPILFRVAEPMIRQKQITWLGRDNGYTPAMHAYLVDEAAANPPKQDFETDWRARWREHEQRPLTGAWTFTGNEPAFPASFRLSPDAPAATWRLDGGPIGSTLAETSAPLDD